MPRSTRAIPVPALMAIRCKRATTPTAAAQQATAHVSCNNAPPVLVEAPIPLHDTDATLAPAHCPTCGGTTLPHTPDTIDRFAINMGLSRTMAQTFLENTRKLAMRYNPNGQHHVNGRAAITATIKSLDLEDWARTMQTTATPTTGQPHSNGITPVHYACSHCAQTFTLTRRTPHVATPSSPSDAPQGSTTAHSSVPQWCPFCGHHGTLTATTVSPDETAFHVLGHHYHIDPLAAEAMYMMWSTGYKHYSYFADFMADLPKLAARSITQATVPPKGQ